MQPRNATVLGSWIAAGCLREVQNLRFTVQIVGFDFKAQGA